MLTYIDTKPSIIEEILQFFFQFIIPARGGYFIGLTKCRLSHIKISTKLNYNAEFG